LFVINVIIRIIIYRNIITIIIAITQHVNNILNLKLIYNL
jgi:hypothetical protein